MTALSDVTSVGSGAIITSTERIKLSGIEASADVTDATNVQAAGAVMTTGDQTIAGNKTFSNNVVVQGQLTMSGSATKINSTNTDISDNLIVLNSELSSTNPNDSGILINRGTIDPSANAFIGWDESADKFIMGTTTADGTSIGNLSITPGNFIIKDISGNDASFNVVDINKLNLTNTITNSQLTNSAVTVTAGDGLSGGGSVSLGSSVSLAVQVDDSSLEINSDTLRVQLV